MNLYHKYDTKTDNRKQQMTSCANDAGNIKTLPVYFPKLMTQINILPLSILFENN